MSTQLSTIFFIASGIGTTISYTLTVLPFALMLGILLALMVTNTSRIMHGIATLYISIIRGTPFLVQLSLVYFALPQVTGFSLNMFVAGVLALSLNSGAYIAEILRSGIQSLDKGQIDAAHALGITPFLLWKDIILPQVFTAMLPALINEMSALIKETALLSIIGELDIMRRAELVAAEQFNYFRPLLIAGACYYVLVLVLSQCATYFEKKGIS